MLRYATVFLFCLLLLFWNSDRFIEVAKIAPEVSFTRFLHPCILHPVSPNSYTLYNLHHNSKTWKLTWNFFFGCSVHMEFPGQESDLSLSCSPRHSCSNTGSLTHCPKPGIKPASLCSQDTANSIAPQPELLIWNLLSWLFSLALRPWDSGPWELSKLLCISVVPFSCWIESYGMVERLLFNHPATEGH